MKKMICFTLLIVCILLVSCADNEPLVITENDTTIVIKVIEEPIDGSIVLLDYMDKLKQKGQIDFNVENGMITSVNGIENAKDFSKCWMLYTSDSDNSNPAWGTVDYNGNIYGSSIFGADKLEIKKDELYFWVYK